MTKTLTAAPTKELFVEMLVRDIDLVAAVCDLVDNAVDAARRVRPDQDYEGLHINLKVSRADFAIDDNCGGMALKAATSYAFRFGRPSKFDPEKHSIGLFGVGMKRALFKLGSEFTVHSDDGKDPFIVTVNVRTWLDNEDKWEFEFDTADSLDEPGTSIHVSTLREGVAAQLGSDRFRTELAVEIGRRHQAFIARGLAVRINSARVKPRVPKLLRSDEIVPAYRHRSRNSEHPRLITQIYCGLDDGEPRDAGWYLFCNDRLILGPDQTERTGWGAMRGLPRFHPQYRYFRGFVYFDADDPAQLPWNTMKTDVDVGAPAFRAARDVMLTMMQPVISFLNKVKLDSQEAALKKSMEAAERVPLSEIQKRAVFEAPSLGRREPEEELKRISYRKPASEVEIVKQALGVSTQTAVGEKTFEYFFASECEDE